MIRRREKSGWPLTENTAAVTKTRGLAPDDAVTRVSGTKTKRKGERNAKGEGKGRVTACNRNAKQNTAKTKGGGRNFVNSTGWMDAKMKDARG